MNVLHQARGFHQMNTWTADEQLRQITNDNAFSVSFAKEKSKAGMACRGMAPARSPRKPFCCRKISMALTPFSPDNSLAVVHPGFLPADDLRS